MSTGIPNLWPRKIEAPKDEVVALLQEQGKLLGESTEDLLIAEVKRGYQEYTCEAPDEVVQYIIRPENGFLYSIGYCLFVIKRKGDIPYPFTMTVFPGDKDEKTDVTVFDYKSFVKEYTKLVRSEKALTIISHMVAFVKGYRANDVLLEDELTGVATQPQPTPQPVPEPLPSSDPDPLPLPLP